MLIYEAKLLALNLRNKLFKCLNVKLVANNLRSSEARCRNGVVDGEGGGSESQEIVQMNSLKGALRRIFILAIISHLWILLS